MKIDYLAKKNEHERDKYIEFDEGPHIYTVHGELGYTSVTTWNHHHFPVFDSNKIIDNMMGGKNWNNKEKNTKYWNQTTDKPMTKEEIKSMWDKNRDEAAAARVARKRQSRQRYAAFDGAPNDARRGYFARRQQPQV